MFKKTHSAKQFRCCVVKSICIILMLAAVGTNELRLAHAGMTESLTEGVKQASQMFGINTAADLADLVAKAFSNAATPMTDEKKKPDFFSSFFQHLKRQKKIKTTTTTTAASSTHKTEEEDDLDEESQLQNKQESLQYDSINTNMLRTLLRMVGFDARRFGAIALNALVMMAQAIGNTLLNVFTRKRPVVSGIEDGRLFMNKNGEPITKSDESQEKAKENDITGEIGGESPQNNRDYRPRQVRSGSPLDWFLENPTIEMEEQLSQAMDSKLADKILYAMEEYGKANPKYKVDCMKMLMCKMAPLMWAMQRSLEKSLGGFNESDKDEYQITDYGVFNPSILRKQLPSLEEFRKRRITCEERYGKICQ